MNTNHNPTHTHIQIADEFEQTERDGEAKETVEGETGSEKCR